MASEASAGAPTGVAIAGLASAGAAARAALTPRTGPGRCAPCNVGVGSVLWRAMAVAQDTIERSALQDAFQNSADDLSDDLLPIAAEGPTRIFVASVARTVARAFELGAASCCLAHFRAHLRNLTLGLAKSSARRCNRRDGLVIRFGCRP